MLATVALTVGEFAEQQKRRLARNVAEVIVAAGIPAHLITIVFRHIRGDEIAVGRGEFPFWPEGAAPQRVQFARAEVTGELTGPQKRQIAKGIGEALVDSGVPEDVITVIFRPVDPADVHVGRGESPFR